MSRSSAEAILSVFASRLDTLTHLLKNAEQSFGGSAAFLERRLAPDMAPMGTQVAFTCNQPRNFARWLQGEPADNLDPSVQTLDRAYDYIASTQGLLRSCPPDDERFLERVRVDLGPSHFVEVPGDAYVHEFLIPNFYFHLVTAYGILRMSGVTIGKADYMRHLMPLVQTKA
jgi:hypothetical protein